MAPRKAKLRTYPTATEKAKARIDIHFNKEKANLARQMSGLVLGEEVSHFFWFADGQCEAKYIQTPSKNLGRDQRQ
jgi:hypothetical protein